MKVATSQDESSPFRTAAQRAEERVRKREALLRAAVRMFNVRGFHATSLDEVAASLKVSKPTVYHYLGNKDQVLLECVSIGLDQLRQAADAALTKSGSGLERLKQFLIRYAEINMDDFGRCVIRTGDEVLSPESAVRFRALKQEVDQAMRALIRQGMEDGSIERGDVKLVAFTLAGALNWPARWFDPGRGEDSRTIAVKMVDILTRGIEPRP